MIYMNIFLKKLFLTTLLLVFLFAPIQGLYAADDSLSQALNTGLTILSITNPSIGAIFNIATGLTSPEGSIAYALVKAVADVFVKFTGSLLSICYDFLKFVSSSDFLGASTTGSDNIIVSTGWSQVRNLANIALVFGLIVIAISIILGFQENTAKKTLINFIIIAVLINFTPVICGIIIDASNSIMNGLLTAAQPNNYFLDAGNDINKFIRNSNGIVLDVIAYTIILGIFYLASAVLIFFYVILFLTRFVILWILVIVSPLAFASRVFPINSAPIVRRIFPSVFFWDEWWSQFLNWCTMGITACLFLYLGNVLMNTMGTIHITTLASIIYYLIPFFFLLCGLSVCMSSGGIVGGLQNVGGGAALGVVAGFLGAQKARAQKWVVGRAKRAGTYVAEGAMGRAAAPLATGKLSSVVTASPAEREAGRYKFRGVVGGLKEAAVATGIASPEFLTTKSKEQSAAEAMAKNVDFDQYKKLRNSPLAYTPIQKTAIEKKLIEEDLPKFLNLAKNETGQINAEEYNRLLRSVAENGNEKIKEKAFMNTYSRNLIENKEVAKLLGIKFKNDQDVEIPENSVGEDNIRNFIIKKIKDKDSAQIINKNFFRDRLNVAQLSGTQLATIATHGGREKVDTINETIANTDAYSLMRGDAVQYLSKGGAAAVYMVPDERMLERKNFLAGQTPQPAPPAPPNPSEGISYEEGSVPRR